MRGSMLELYGAKHQREEGLSVRGTMLWFNEEKHHGVITTDAGERVAVHRNGFDENAPEGPCAGLVVEFQVADSADGPRAEHVRVVPEVAPRRARRRHR